MHATIHIFTYKSGLLARMAHDLQLTAQRCELTLQGRQLHAACAADSLRVDGAVTSHGLAPDALSATDKQQVEQTVRTEILDSARYPTIELTARIDDGGKDRLRVSGTLRVRDQERPIEVEVQRRGDSLQTELELTPSQFGIAPYKALAGAIKLQDRVRVVVTIALAGQQPAALLAQSEPKQPP
jgi:hypothetical protein